MKFLKSCFVPFKSHSIVFSRFWIDQETQFEFDFWSLKYKTVESWFLETYLIWVTLKELTWVYHMAPSLWITSVGHAVFKSVILCRSLYTYFRSTSRLKGFSFFSYFSYVLMYISNLHMYTEKKNMHWPISGPK